MVKVRLKFSKRGPIRFIGHLDLMRYFQKVNRRADIDVKYSEGFSPHQVLSFAEPLSVGATSDGEYLDIQMNSEPDMKVLIYQLNSVMNEGVEILDGCILDEHAEKAMALVDAAEWIMTFREGKEPEAGWEDRLVTYMAKDNLPAIKKTKRGETEINMKPLIFKSEVVKKKDLKGFSDPEYRFVDNNIDDEISCIHIFVSSGSADHLKPGMVVENFMRECGEEMQPNAIRLHRVETFLKGEDEKGTFEVPMTDTEGKYKIYL
ncbi:radical SAM-linked protein [Butyrivibrio fibrisolvens DSM 3071]|uniref:Radical SAM-linked protein n=1 Tax=Butyrivibrio fibrisolvens DSM 3071 TaxID=1121131 RepID=A0A1M5ZG74_BUTFI|nr:TIGR03936 family radical SAM-associated protein [Butyrivibrio fibrisolvens]SHI23265.1 radical SAM-linked protein [Butyrivibrio fibrisolvens DSM 3071]